MGLLSKRFFLIDTVFILAGGRGTRLGNLTKNTPKPMLKIAGKPFIEHIIDNLDCLKFKKIVISTGYKHSKFKEYFDTINSSKISIYHEKKPLGTGGAVKHYLNNYSDTKNILVMNGDSFIFDDQYYLNSLNRIDNDCLVGVTVKNRSRFGSVITDKDNNIIDFQEKKLTGPGFINAGIYFFSDINFLRNEMNIYPSTFSFEEFLSSTIKKRKIKILESSGKIIDMGTPESLEEMRLKFES